MPVTARLAVLASVVVAIASPAFADGASCPAGSAPTSGGGGYVAADTSKFNGQVVGNGQCAVFTEAAVPGIGQVSTWKPGELVQGATDIPVGTAIATFNFNGSYGSASNPAGVSGQSHTGLYMGQNAQGVIIEDQYAGKAVSTHTIPWSQWSGGTAEAGNKYYVVSNPNAAPPSTAAASNPSAAPSAASCTPTQSQTSANPSPAPSATASSTTPGSSTGPATAPTLGASTGGGAANPAVTLNLASGAPAASTTATSSDMTMGDPKICWICNGAQYALGTVEAVATNAPAAIVKSLWPLIVTLAAFSLIMGVARDVVAGREVWSGALASLGRVAVVGALFAGGALQPFGGDGSAGGDDPGVYVPLTDTGSSGPATVSPGYSGNGSLLFDYVMGPPISAGARIGADLARKASSALGVNLQPGNCSYDSAATAKITKLADASTALMTVMCVVHVAAMTGVELGATLVINDNQATTLMDKATGWLMLGVGLAVMFLSVMAAVNFGFAVIEVIVKVGVLVAFLPLFAFAWLFETTRSMTRTVFDSMLFSFIYFVLSGLASVVMVYVMMQAFSFGLGQSAGSAVDSASLISQFQQTMSANSLNSGQGLAKAVLLVCFSLAGCLMSTRILGSAHDIAVELSGFQMGARGEIAKVGSNLASTTMGVATAASGLVVGVGARAVGGLAGSVAGSLSRGGANQPKAARSGVRR